MRSLQGAIIAGIFWMQAFAACSAPAEEVVDVGVRGDARPFVWYDGNSMQYLGFFWDICSEAVHRAGYQIHADLLDIRKRTEFLKTGKGEFDLLCDPTTLTIERLRNFTDVKNGGKASDLSFSPIIFIANSSFVEPGRGATRKRGGGTISATIGSNCKDIMSQQTAARSKPGDDGKSDAGATSHWYDLPTITMMPDEPKPNETVVRYEIWGYVAGTNIGDILQRWWDASGKERQVCLRDPPLSSHKDAATEFCEGRLARYFGDIDIVKAAIADYQSQTGRECAADVSNSNGSYEPYAFVLSSKHFGNFPERFTLALYGMFQDGTMERLFEGHFPGSRKSQYLDVLFAINSIPAGFGESKQTFYSGGK
ncbi:transporter substrate-binding domain-containing protein [Rhizobium leguminosarum]|nr:transporter substrate-binding domain-containing protein [Rhizobium leguminosarum]